MKPFDLEAAKFGDPVVTRDGRKAYFFGINPKSKYYPLVMEVEGVILSFTMDGFGNCRRSIEDLDLFMEGEQHPYCDVVIKEWPPVYVRQTVVDSL